MTQPATVFEVGAMTFGEITTDPRTGRTPSPQQRVQETIEQARTADQAGLDVFGIGEHHRSDFIASAPSVLLAGAATVTERVRLASTVTVLSSDDPVRVYEQFATLDLLSGGRAEIMAGRGSYTESFPLFGYSLGDYDELFEEKLDLLLRIREQNPVSWTGRTRPPLQNADIAPRALQDPLPVWRAVGGNPGSAVAAGRAGLPLVIGFLVGPITAHQRLVGYYRAAAAQAGVPDGSLRVGASVHGYVGRTSQGARDVMYPYFAQGMRENNHQRGRGFDISRSAFDDTSGPAGMLVVGSPAEVVDKILTYREVYGIDRILLQMGFGGVPQREHLDAIELLGTEVAPALRRELATNS
ncbi:LLM class flavin-dependent oxidoreductase [uncultured Aeromicrobium sp.]|uniref:LLM class flavin-dependent oxidoreductase n=1 Tax=uncultured Aeromicrobium sp. TaxID=337820 RepID=UPI0025FD544A|nr:LLM class flavin-dependent oxidoreductase [uncultured Aeromicrobium sp.]